jgi:hypothetical protein
MPDTELWCWVSEVQYIKLRILQTGLRNASALGISFADEWQDYAKLQHPNPDRKLSTHESGERLIWFNLRQFV